MHGVTNKQNKQLGKKPKIKTTLTGIETCQKAIKTAYILLIDISELLSITSYDICDNKIAEPKNLIRRTMT